MVENVDMCLSPVGRLKSQRLAFIQKWLNFHLLGLCTVKSVFQMPGGWIQQISFNRDPGLLGEQHLCQKSGRGLFQVPVTYS